MSPTPPIRPDHSNPIRPSHIQLAQNANRNHDSDLIQKGHTIHKALMEACSVLEKQGEKEISLNTLNISLGGKMMNASDALHSWYKDAASLAKGDMLQSNSVLSALQGSMSLGHFKEILGHSAQNLPSSATFYNSVESLAVATPSGPSVTVTHTSDAGSDYVNIDIENLSLENLLQGIVEKCQSNSTSNLVTNLIASNISILNKTIELTAQASNGIKTYISACNDLINQMNSAASVFKGSNPPDTIDGDAFYNEMIKLGFSSGEISVHGSSGHDMDADNIQTNVAMINSRVDVMSQQAQQYANILSQLNQTNQQVLQFFENFLQGVSSANQTIASNL